MNDDVNPLSCLLWVLAICAVIWMIVDLATGHI